MSGSVTEYVRDTNVNTPEYWDKAWSSQSELGTGLSVHEKAEEILSGLPHARVVEYGFGRPALARLIGADRWEGRDFSAVAVEKARAEGFTAFVTRCKDSPGYRRAYVVALQVLEHLDEDEMLAFLDKSRNAPHAIFSVPLVGGGDIQKHMRGWGSEAQFAEFIGNWWPHVKTSVVTESRTSRIVAHAARAPISEPPVLTVGSSTLLDFHGVLYTFAALRTFHGDFGGKVEFLLADNHPEPTSRLRGCKECDRLGKDGPVCSACRKAVEDMEAVARQEGARYFRWAEKQGTYPGKNRLKHEARGKWVLTMDSHVMLSPFALERCLEVIEANPESDDFYHFPNLFKGANGRPAAVDHRNLDWIYRAGDKSERGSVYGWTKEANKAGEPYPIAAMITSCYLLRRKAWFSAKGYDPILGNYGGWEGPLQLKWRLLGRDVLSLRHAEQKLIDKHGFLHHWHLFCKPGTRMANQTGRVHTSWTKQRNFAASSAIIGGEKFVREHCAWKGWDFNAENIQEGFAEGMKLRPWMVENLADPEWEDIDVFFAHMREKGIPGALRG